MPLTDTACRNAKCPADRPRERYTDSGGLYLEVQPTGSKYWRWKYRFAGKEKRLSLGTYPAVSLAIARRERDVAREKVKTGLDPVQVKKDQKLADRLRMGNTFEAVARAWFAHWKGPRSPRHADYVLRRLEMDVFPDIGSKPVSEITAPQLLAMAKKIESRGALDIARRAWQTCGQVFEYALAHGVAERNPTKDIRPSVALKPRDKQHFARLEARELPEFLRKIEAYQGTPFTRFALQLMALTFVRTSELIGARWQDFDLDAAEWRIPGRINDAAGNKVYGMKMGTPHVVPLSTQAVDVLRCLEEIKGLSGLVFPGERDHEKPMSNGAILGALRRMGYQGRMTGHGFRGIASTVLHELGFDHAHIELQLAHQERDDTSAAYNFATYLGPRRRMMQAWADHLDALRQGARILPIKAA
ncbi:MAG TPA: integrase arm-type DNA-binding domain-containing protein [Burkholderiaceae bacterium]|jgi:integrase